MNHYIEIEDGSDCVTTWMNNGVLVTVGFDFSCDDYYLIEYEGGKLPGDTQFRQENFANRFWELVREMLPSTEARIGTRNVKEITQEHYDGLLDEMKHQTIFPVPEEPTTVRVEAPRPEAWGSW